MVSNHVPHYSNFAAEVYSLTAALEILNQGQTVLKALTAIIGLLEKSNKTREANTLKDVLEICRQPRELGGLDISKDEQTSSEQEAEIMFLSSAWLEALNSVDRAASLPDPILQRPVGRRGMTLSEKIFAMHDLTNKGFVVPGELIRVHVDWVIASEASWAVSKNLPGPNGV
jgi:hypothetical protein